MKKNILQSNKSGPDEGYTLDIGNTTIFSENKVRLLSLIIGMFLFCLPFATFAQTNQQDLRLLTTAYEPGKCPANDIRVVSASLNTGSPCLTCTEGPVTAPLTIRINHNTESPGRYLAICGTIVEHLSGGGTVETDISKCFGPLLKNSEQIGGGQNLASFNVTFTCGSTLELTDILLVWTAANGGCPVTLDNNPNGKYCWNNPNVDIPTAIVLTETHVDAGCFGSATGSINLSVSGGASPYTYAWTASAGGFIPSGQEDDQDLNGLIAGTYSVTVTDSKGCTATKSGIAIGQDPLTVPDITKAPDSYSDVCGKSAAQAQADVNAAFAAWLAVAPVPSGGTLPYASVVQSPLNPSAPAYTGGSTSVTWTVTDHCGQTDFVTVDFTVSNPCNIVCASEASPVSCNGGSNGSITVSASGGNPPYTFHLFLTSDGTFANELQTLTDNIAPTEPGQVTFSGLSAENYTVLITDGAHDIDNAQACDGVEVSQPAALTCTVAKVSDVACNGESNGSATVSPVGGNGGNTFLWDNGETTATATGLNAGLHSVTVTDSKGCTTSCDVTIGEPAALTCTVAKVSDAVCNGESNGSATVSPVGGNGGNTFLWDNGETTATATGLNAGLHSVTVTDSKGCTTSCDVTIGEPAALTCTVAKVSDAECNGQDNGSATVTPVGGNGGNTYLWDNGETTATAVGLSAGLHSVTVTDSKGCTTSCEVTIGQPAGLTCTVAKVSDVACNGESNGSATVTPVGGNGGNTFLWDNGETTATATGLSAGSHSVTVTDSKGCTTSCNVTIGGPAALTCTVAKVSDVACNGESNGSATVTPVGGNGGNTF
ncbi:SprB repeat-containing protein [Flavobacterium suncheonense]